MKIPSTKPPVAPVPPGEVQPPAEVTRETPDMLGVHSPKDGFVTAEVKPPQAPSLEHAVATVEAVREAKRAATAQAVPHDRNWALSELKSKLTKITDGVLFPSESDYPFEYFYKPGAAQKEVTPAEFLRLIGRSPDTPIEVRDPKEFLDHLLPEGAEDWWTPQDHSDAARYADLLNALNENLTDVRLYRVGEVEVGCHFVGRNRFGDLVGVSTVSVET